jgi:hypothetical protein
MVNASLANRETENRGGARRKGNFATREVADRLDVRATER